MTLPPDVFAGSAVAVGIIHTVIGVDHYLPFLVLGKAQGWTFKKILGVTFLCGLAHVTSSIALGMAGVGLGMSLQRFHVLHSVQGNIAAWSLIVFGLTYAAWSFARSRRLHGHAHAHGDQVHAHLPADHDRLGGARQAALVTTWSLFIIFVLGPCEPLIPLMIVPALQHNIASAMHVAAVFSMTTISAMLGLVTVGYYGIHLISVNRLETHANTLAGLAIAITGIAMRVFGI